MMFSCLASVIFTLGVSWQVSGAQDLLAVPGVDAPASTSLAVQGRLALQPDRQTDTFLMLASAAAHREMERDSFMTSSDHFSCKVVLLSEPLVLKMDLKIYTIQYRVNTSFNVFFNQILPTMKN